MRRRSLAGPILLILIGGAFLWANVKPGVPVLQMAALYWPFILVAWGALRLIEVLAAAVSSRPMPQRSFTGGETALIILICIFGTGLYTVRHGLQYDFRRWDVFGEPYDFPVVAHQTAAGAQRIVLDHLRGNVRVTGADVQEISITGRKTIRAMNRAEAAQADQQSPVEFATEGDTITVRTNQEQSQFVRGISSDLEIIVPRGVSFEARGRSNDFDFQDLNGNVSVASGKADVRLSRIGGNARIEVRGSDLIRAVDVKGGLDLQGRGSDIDLQRIAGQVTINGSYGGSLQFTNLARPIVYESSSTQFRVEGLPGQIRMDLGEFTADDVVGPIRLVTRSRDVTLRNFTQSLDLQTDRGDIELQPDRVPLARIQARSRAGKIDLRLPQQAKFELTATAERGEALNDFGPAIQAEVSGRAATLKGTVGKGPEINLVTERGAISVRKAAGGGGVKEAKL